MKKLFVVFGIIILIFAGFIFYQFRSSTAGKSNNTQDASAIAKINKQTFKVGVADSPEEWQKGLSGRESLPEDQGMIFLFKTTEYHTFWMKDMKFPIDIIFIKDDAVVSIVKDANQPGSAKDNLPLYKPEAPANKVLEINAGLSEKYDIKKGDKVEIKL